MLEGLLLTVNTPTFSMLGLMQRTKKGLEALRVPIRECRESWATNNRVKCRWRHAEVGYELYIWRAACPPHPPEAARGRGGSVAAGVRHAKAVAASVNLA